ncbi:acetolactate synthase-1/2/3 large subunit [Stella humosa]|uniref:Acetolactate synthase-1/2/3 large subunit n=1 Tax=Stella humosa TaxID=94 RepID=A0A3N1LIR4_9PROT|nr:acetolactate synthase catalytic subunit [Stella humosa]ROP91180.1 acetolactate synthase-1/2/3 large subunit [Stella humosa]BBK34468.1 acetolactate synthase large subunit [Stella humosa]
MLANENAAHTIVRAFRRHGVEVAFGQSIPTAFHLIAPGYGIRQFAYRTENAGAAMADGYARISNRVAVVTAQNGPAATLLVPGLAEALKASIPIVALVQDVARGATDRNAFQELDHIDLFRGVAKWVRRVAKADRIDDYVDMAFTAAAGGRPGPAVLIVPIDLFQDAAPKESGRVASLGAYPLDRPQADPAMIAAAADLLAGAAHPLVVAGGGIHSSGAAAALAALQEAAHLPVGTTSMGKGAVDEGHPLSVGVIGYFMGRRGVGKFMRPIVDRADVVLLVGNRTNQNGTDSWKLFPKGARFIHLDIDGQEIGRNYEAMRLQGDARATLTALTEALAARDLGARAAGRSAVEAAIREGRRAHLDEAAAMTGATASPMRPERIMAEIDRRLTPDTIVVADASYASIWINNYLRARRPGQRFLTPRGIAGLGWGLPMAIGAKVASPASPVICVAGDGGFAHVWAELETARRMGTPVAITVLNNQILGYQKHAETATHGAHTDAVAFAPVDHAAIARACGCLGVRIEDPEAYGPALEAALAADRPTVIDVVTDPEAYPPVTAFDGRLGGQ